MTGRGVDLSGRWSGVYFFPIEPVWNPDDRLPPTPFAAFLEDVGGRISGRTVEPDYWSGPDAPDIPATLEGRHHNGRLTFTKAPQGGGQIHTIDYLGDVSPDGNTISGQWIIYGEWSGTFRMQRSDVRAAKAIEPEAAL